MLQQRPFVTLPVTAALTFALGQLLSGCSDDAASGSDSSTGGTSSSSGGSSSGGSSSGGSSSGGSSSGGSSPDDSGERLPDHCNGPCNAFTAADPVLTDTTGHGSVTMYTTEPSQGGACLYGNTGIAYFAAINVSVSPGDGKGQWNDGRICGQCVEVQVRTSTSIQSVVVRIMDRCADANCGIDLGGQAPAQVMLDGFGRYEGVWKFVSCDGHPEVFDGPTALHVKEGSNGYWAAIQVRNPPTAVDAIDWKSGSLSPSSGTLTYSSPQMENYYLVPSEVLRSNADVELTIRFRDGSTRTRTVASAKLGEADTDIALE
jgi:expansin (peptidoglycan-binding protein)